MVYWKEEEHCDMYYYCYCNYRRHFRKGRIDESFDWRYILYSYDSYNVVVVAAVMMNRSTMYSNRDCDCLEVLTEDIDHYWTTSMMMIIMTLRAGCIHN